jgi:hypothetical protein
LQIHPAAAAKYFAVARFAPRARENENQNSQKKRLPAPQ